MDIVELMTIPVGQVEIDRAARARSLIALVSDLVRELHGQGGRALDVALSSRLDRDLGIDSLGRTELVLRIERAFRVRLPVSVMGEADTVADILAALEQAAPDTRIGVAAEAPLAAQPSSPPPLEAKTLVDVLEWHVARNPDRLHVTVLQDESTVLATMTYGELSRGGAGGRGRADRARHRAGRSRRPHAADRHRFLLGVLRHSLYRRRAGADLSADAIVAARGLFAPAGRNPAQRRGPDSGDRSGGRCGSAACCAGCVPSLGSIESVGNLTTAPAAESRCRRWAIRPPPA